MDGYNESKENKILEIKKALTESKQVVIYVPDSMDNMPDSGIVSSGLPGGLVLMTLDDSLFISWGAYDSVYNHWVVSAYITSSSVDEALETLMENAIKSPSDIEYSYRLVAVKKI